jgi:hypothetical protein
MSPAIPLTLRVAAACIGAYGVVVLTQAVAAAMVTEWADKVGLFRALGRCAGASYVAYYLLNGARWAWYVAVVGSGVLLLLALIGGPLVALSGLLGDLPLGTWSVAFFGASVLLLLGASICLLLPRTRRVFFPAPPLGGYAS